MASAGIGDFWRRRKIFIILGVLFLCVVATVYQLQRSKAIKNRSTGHQQDFVKHRLEKAKGNIKNAKDTKKALSQTFVKNLAPVLDQHRLRAKKLKLDFGDAMGKKHDPGMDYGPHGDKPGVSDGGKWGRLVGEAPLEDLDKGRGVASLVDKEEEDGDSGEQKLQNELPQSGEQKPQNEFPQSGGQKPPQSGRQNPPQSGGQKVPDSGGQPQPRRWNRYRPGSRNPPVTGNRSQNMPVQPGNQPGNPPIQPIQPGNPPIQPGNPPIQPGNLPHQPIQSGNPPIQPGNPPIQPGTPPIQPGTPPIQPGNPQIQPGNPPNQPGHLPNQLPNQPRNPPIHSGNPPNQSGGPGSAGSLYVHSSMPLGQPLSSVKTVRQEAVVQAFKHAWKAYKQYAWGQDEVNPISRTSTSTYFNLGMTLVDSLDTLWLMGLDQEFREARNWVAQSLNIERNTKTVSLFETNIRVLGGLLSAYHLSGDKVFLDKALTLGSRLLPAFNTPSGIPSNTVSLSTGAHTGRSISAAEAGSLQLEFRDLSRASSNPIFQDKCDRTLDKMLSQSRGIVRQTLNCKSGAYSGSVYSAGAGIDSYYEYLIKQWIQSGRTENKFRDAYETSVQDVLRYLVGYSKPSHMAYLGKRFGLSSNQLPSPVMDHLSCFYPGMLALGGMYGVLPQTRDVAENLTHTCYHMYEVTSPTRLAPEIFQFSTSKDSTNDVVNAADSQNLQRPETVESLFYLYRLTKDERYREWGWKIFQAFETHTKVQEGGYACLKNVHTPGKFRDRMESFFLTETLKYLYLLFGDDDTVLSLNEWVFNTEAHPLPIWKMS